MNGDIHMPDADGELVVRDVFGLARGRHGMPGICARSTPESNDDEKRRGGQLHLRYYA